MPDIDTTYNTTTNGTNDYYNFSGTNFLILPKTLPTYGDYRLNFVVQIDTARLAAAVGTGSEIYQALLNMNQANPMPLLSFGFKTGNTLPEGIYCYRDANNSNRLTLCNKDLVTYSYCTGSEAKIYFSISHYNDDDFVYISRAQVANSSGQVASGFNNTLQSQNTYKLYNVFRKPLIVGSNGVDFIPPNYFVNNLSGSITSTVTSFKKVHQTPEEGGDEPTTEPAIHGTLSGSDAQGYTGWSTNNYIRLPYSFSSEEDWNFTIQVDITQFPTLVPDINTVAYIWSICSWGNGNDCLWESDGSGHMVPGFAVNYSGYISGTLFGTQSWVDNYPHPWFELQHNATNHTLTPIWHIQEGTTITWGDIADADWGICDNTCYVGIGAGAQLPSGIKIMNVTYNNVAWTPSEWTYIVEQDNTLDNEQYAIMYGWVVSSSSGLSITSTNGQQLETIYTLALPANNSGVVNIYDSLGNKLSNYIGYISSTDLTVYER